MEIHLVTGRREMKGGLEKVTYEVSLSAISRVAERSQGSEEVVRSALVGWYCYSPRPDPRDILSSSIRPLENGRAEVTLIIKRGHYSLLSYLHNHEDVKITKEGKVSCSCHPGVERWIFRHTLPNYEGQFDEREESSNDERSPNPLPSGDQ